MTSYLAQKRTLLSAPGSVLNDLYESKYTNTVSAVECTYFTSIQEYTLSSLSFGSTNNVNIPNDNFLCNIWLNLTLPTLVGNQTLPRGWGYSCIDSISFSWGASSSQFTIGGMAVLLTALSQCSTEEERSEIMRLAGDEYLENPPTPVGQDPHKITASVLLPFPCSSFCAEKVPFDTSILSSNITLSVKFKVPSAIFGGSGIHPVAFQKANITVREGVLSNRQQSLRNEMIADPSLIYNYSFTHHQQQTYTLTGKRESEGYRAASVRLDSFLNSDLFGIYIVIIKNTDISPTGNLPPNPINFAPIYNPEVLYNGQPIFRADSTNWKLYSMHSNSNPSFFHNSIISQNSNVEPFNSSPVDSYILYIDFSKIRQECHPEHTSNVFRIANQTLQFNLNTAESAEYTLFAIHCYPAIISSQAGTTQVFFS